MVSFTEHLRTDEVYQDGFLKEDLAKVVLKNQVGTVLETDVAVVAEILNLLEVGVNDSSPAMKTARDRNVTGPNGELELYVVVIIPAEGIRFEEREDGD